MALARVRTEQTVITLTITGLDDALAALTALDDLSGLVPSHVAAMELLRYAAQDYPSEPPGSAYIRTYTLRGGWGQPEIDLTGDTITGVLSNAVSYAVWVQGDDQAEVHQGRWETAAEIAARLEGEVVDIIDDGAADWLRGLGW
jgi:hypothetical protein